MFNLSTVIGSHKKECFAAVAQALSGEPHIREEMEERFRLGIPMGHPAYDMVTVSPSGDGWTCDTRNVCRENIIELLRR